MATSIAAATLRLKEQVRHFLSAEFVGGVARDCGVRVGRTPLAVPALVAHFARQILAGNVSMPELAHMAGSTFTPEAYCIARQRLPLALLQSLLAHLQPPAAEASLAWRGHRLWHLDGSSFSMPDTPELQKQFGQPAAQKPGCGFPVAHILCLFDARTGLVRQCLVNPQRTHDMAPVAGIHPALAKGDVLVADRAFESFAHLALLTSRGIHAVMGMHQKRKADFVRKERRTGKRRQRVERQRIRRCGARDQVVRWTKPKQRPGWMSKEAYAALPQTLEVREIKREVRLASGWRTIVLVTTLLDEKAYPALEIMALLKERWQIEVNLRHLKSTMHMDILRSQSVEGVKKELLMFLIVYNLVRLIMREAAERQQVACTRISFADALYWMRHGNLAAPLPRLALLPQRPGRVEPRALKRRPTVYTYLTKPRRSGRHNKAVPMLEYF